MRLEQTPTVVVKYYLYSITISTGFTAPVFVLAVQMRGVSLTGVSILSAVYSVTILVTEAPTGYIADYLGYRRSLLLSVTLLPVSMVAYGFVDGFWEFLVVWVVWATGEAFRSGTADGWLYDALAERNATDQFTRVNGRATTITYLTTAVTSLVAGRLLEFAIPAPFLAAAALNVLGIAVVFTFSEPDESAETTSRLGVSDAFRVLREELFAPQLRSFAIYVALFGGVASAAYLFIQPASRAVGLGIERLGLLYAVLTGAKAVGGFLAEPIRRHVGARRWILAVPFAVGLLLLVPLVVPVVLLPLFVVLEAIKKATKPIRNQYLNDQIQSAGRATVLSTVSMAIYGISALLRVGGGVVGDAFSPVLVFPVLGATLLVGAGLVAVHTESIFDRPSPAIEH